MICEDALALISARLDGELSPEEAEALNAHLEGCPSCRQWMEAMAAVDQKLAALEEPAPAGLKKGVLYRIDQATGKAKKPGRRWFGPGTALGAAAAVLVLLVGLGVIPLQSRMPASNSAELDASHFSPVEAQPVETAAGKPDALPGKHGSHAVQGSKGDSEDRDELLAPPGEESAQFPAATQLPAWEFPESNEVPLDTRHVSGPDGNASEPAADELLDACAALCAEEDAMVLLYTDFDADSVFGLLKAEEPALYALTEAMRSVEENGLLRYETDCGTALAIQEWLLAELPPAQTVSVEAISAERRVKVRMEALDPGNSSLRRVIRFSQAAREIDWPELWPADWADRLRAGESWELYFPDADYTPNSGKKAFLVFSGGAE